jgi:hypothetical protein
MRQVQRAGRHRGSAGGRQESLAGAVEQREPHGVRGGEIFTRGAIITEKRPRGRPVGRAGRVQSQLLA